MEIASKTVRGLKSLKMIKKKSRSSQKKEAGTDTVESWSIRTLSLIIYLQPYGKQEMHIQQINTGVPYILFQIYNSNNLY